MSRQTHPIPNFCHLYLEYRFLSQYHSRAKILMSPASRLAVKSRILLKPRIPNFRHLYH